MATKRLKSVRIGLEIPLPAAYPMAIHADVVYTIDGLTEVGEKVIGASGSIPNGSVTWGTILNNIKAALEAAAQNEGSGGHSTVE